jgi:hypothetical protein
MRAADPAMPSRPTRTDTAAVWAVLAISYAAYLAIFLPLLPPGGIGLGHDYAQQLPNLLTGYFYFLRNGLWQVPWFTPAQCAGVPFFGDLNVGYFTLPGFLTFLTDPLSAVRITFAVFAAIGLVGAYALARVPFRASQAASVAVAVIFLFNGFYAYRVLIGHLTFHPVMLAPWLGFVLLPSARGSLAVAAVLGGTVLSLMFEAGMVHGIMPVVFATILILLAHGQVYGHAWRPWLALAGSLVVCVALSAARLVAALAFLRAFPRTDYPLPGFEGLWTTFAIAFQSVFWMAPGDAAWSLLANKLYMLQQHEWEYGVGPAAALLIAAGLLAIVAAWARGNHRIRRFSRALPVVVLFVTILFLPLAVNWYEPTLNAFLKRIPIIASSSSLTRWFLTYVPLAALFAGLAIDRTFSPATRPIVALVVVASVLSLNAVSDKRFYSGQAYDATAITGAWHRARTLVPSITVLAGTDRGLPGLRAARNGNDVIADGESQIRCYQPMFGYALERFDASNLHPGPITDVDAAGNLNLKNPACYLYPAENHCRPGDLFKATAIADATAFAAYRPYPFKVSALQRAADWLNLAAILGCLAVLAIIPLRRCRPRRRLDANRPSG